MSDQLDLWPDEWPADRISWSVSRDKRLRQCQRLYYLQHFGGRGGAKPGAEKAAREIYILKHLRSRYMWVGEIVHLMIELALQTWRRGQMVSPSALVERGTRLMRAQYAESLQGLYNERPREACGLVEHEYREIVSREKWQAARDRMEQALRGFFELEIVNQIRATPVRRWLALENMASFELEGATIIVKPDFVWQDEDDHIWVLDWKTGQPHLEDDQLQLGAYGLYARATWGLHAEITGLLLYLDSKQSVSMPLSEADLEKPRAAISESLKTMRYLAKNSLNISAFPMTPDLERCIRCNFRRVCERLRPPN